MTNWILSKLKTLVSSKDTIKKMKKRKTGRKYLQIINLIKYVYLEYTKTFYNSIRRETTQ